MVSAMMRHKCNFMRTNLTNKQAVAWHTVRCLYFYFFYIIQKFVKS